MVVTLYYDVLYFLEREKFIQILFGWSFPEAVGTLVKWVVLSYSCTKANKMEIMLTENKVSKKERKREIRNLSNEGFTLGSIQ